MKTQERRIGIWNAKFTPEYRKARKMRNKTAAKARKRNRR